MALDSLAFPPTRQRLLKGKHLIPNFLKLHALDMDVWDDGFKGDLFFGGAAPGVYQSTANGANSAVAAISTGAVGGKIRLDPGDANSGRCDLSLGLHYTTSRNVTVWWRVTLPAAITAMKFELGLTDVISGTDAGAVNSKGGNTFTATDCTVLCYDTSDDTNLTLMSANGGGIAATVYDFSTALAAATDYYFGISTVGTRSKGFLLNANAVLLEESTWQESANTAATLLTPWAFVQNRAASQHLLDIDRLLIYQWASTTHG